MDTDDLFSDSYSDDNNSGECVRATSLGQRSLTFGAELKFRTEPRFRTEPKFRTVLKFRTGPRFRTELEKTLVT